MRSAPFHAQIALAATLDDALQGARAAWRRVATPSPDAPHPSTAPSASSDIAAGTLIDGTAWQVATAVAGSEEDRREARRFARRMRPVRRAVAAAFRAHRSAAHTDWVGEAWVAPASRATITHALLTRTTRPRAVSLSDIDSTPASAGYTVCAVHGCTPAWGQLWHPDGLVLALAPLRDDVTLMLLMGRARPWTAPWYHALHDQWPVWGASVLSVLALWSLSPTAAVTSGAAGALWASRLAILERRAFDAHRPHRHALRHWLRRLSLPRRASSPMRNSPPAP